MIEDRHVWVSAWAHSRIGYPIRFYRYLRFHLWVRDGRSSPRGKGRLGRGEFALNCIRLCLWSGGIAFVVQRCSSFVAFSYAMQISGRHT
jgi:hypothetical protein